MEMVFLTAKDLKIKCNPTEILWLFYFLKCYNTHDVTHATLGCSYNTYTSTIWRLLSEFDSKWNSIHFSNREKFNSVVFKDFWITTIIDTTECYIVRPKDDVEQNELKYHVKIYSYLYCKRKIHCKC